MNITFITENYYPLVGGVQNVTKYMAEELANKNNSVTVITTSKGYEKEETINGVHIIRFDLRQNKFKQYYGEIKEYINYVLERNDDYTIFECTENITTNLLLPYLKNIKGKKILHAHGFYGLTLKPFLIKDNIMKILGNLYNYIFWNYYYYPYVLSKYINDFDATISLSPIDSSLKYLDKYFKGKKYILGNAAEDIFFNDIDNQKLKYNFKNKKYFLSVAGYRTIKNQIKILKQFSKSNCKKEYELVFIGNKENKYYKKLVKIKNRIKLNNVHILVNIPREDIKIIMQNAFAYIVGSTYEEYSISIIEAMASGIPFISTDVGNAKLLPGGIVLNNINEMSEKMDEIVEKTKLYSKLSKEARDYANENCKIQICIDNFIKILKVV